MKHQFVPAIDYHHLTIMKMTTCRPQDKAEVAILIKINRYKK